MATHVPIVLEIGSKKTFASALDWPGWSRSAKTPEEAVQALAAYRDRYAAVAAAAGVRLPVLCRFDIAEELPGDATTDFGAPSAIADADHAPLSAAAAHRLADLLAGAWTVLDRVAATAPADLRKGPRGGGRDRDKVVQHVLDAETSYVRKLGLKGSGLAAADATAVAAHRARILDVVRATRSGDPLPTPRNAGWPARYAVRRIAWHVVDHAWEIEDRS